MLRHTITGLVLNCIEAITEHCQFSFLWFYAIIHPALFVVNTKTMPFRHYAKPIVVLKSWKSKFTLCRVNLRTLPEAEASRASRCPPDAVNRAGCPDPQICNNWQIEVTCQLFVYFPLRVLPKRCASFLELIPTLDITFQPHFLAAKIEIIKYLIRKFRQTHWNLCFTCLRDWLMD